MKNTAATFIVLALLFCLLMSLPWLVPHCGVLALVGLVPLLVMERLATKLKTKHFWWWHYGTFVVWNAITTWWVANATVGGAIFAILANALQMSLVFGAFRWVKGAWAVFFPIFSLPQHGLPGKNTISPFLRSHGPGWCLETPLRRRLPLSSGTVLPAILEVPCGCGAPTFPCSA